MPLECRRAWHQTEMLDYCDALAQVCPASYLTSRTSRSGLVLSSLAVVTCISVDILYGLDITRFVCYSANSRLV